ncbi:MAG: DUF190 domain-containing protein [Chitinophagaceae bacterium]
MLQAQIYIDREDLHGTQPAFEFIMSFLIRHGIKGATLFKAMMGFGRNHRLQRPEELFSFDEPPLMITFIDNEETVNNVLHLPHGVYRRTHHYSSGRLI